MQFGGRKDGGHAPRVAFDLVRICPAGSSLLYSQGMEGSMDQGAATHGGDDTHLVAQPTLTSGLTSDRFRTSETR